MELNEPWLRYVKQRIPPSIRPPQKPASLEGTKTRGCRRYRVSLKPGGKEKWCLTSLINLIKIFIKNRYTSKPLINRGCLYPQILKPVGKEHRWRSGIFQSSGNLDVRPGLVKIPREPILVSGIPPKSLYFSTIWVKATVPGTGQRLAFFQIR